MPALASTDGAVLPDEDHEGDESDDGAETEQGRQGRTHVLGQDPRIRRRGRVVALLSLAIP
ncbi:MAG: hypothetical protein Q8W51_10005 [Candidatus Palauibacterales bacterium]|nr:hypothetical protein [Candidatus Palauibacterales bacterium]MDP2530063.1 hypothetical protein [Candidatus Palauibacterales bacterium]MDP2584531.1 hypothetical protein [Candidatus Palauibacterales bacterium]